MHNTVNHDKTEALRAHYAVYYKIKCEVENELRNGSLEDCRRLMLKHEASRVIDGIDAEAKQRYRQVWANVV